jgi:hypothetical protein
MRTTGGSGRHVRNRRRMGLTGVVLVAASWGALGVPRVAGAATVPTGTCMDYHYFDGLDTFYSASPCAGALNQAGYSAGAYDNQTATTEVQRSNTDAVFFHNGHALDYYDGAGHTAIALLDESPPTVSTLGDTFDGLLGDPTAAQVAEGPVTICNAQNQCTNTNLVTYPWASTPQMFKFNLIVMEACATSGPSNNFFSEAQMASTLGAGNVLAFSQDVSSSVNVDNSNQFGDAWANRFWGDAGAGYSYASSAIDALNYEKQNSGGGAYGYDSWTLFTSSAAPQSLYPAQYWL